VRDRGILAAALVIVFLGAGACGGRKSPVGLHLPDGSPAAGQQAFVDLKCSSCHRVAGVALPEPVADPIVPVTLGGPWPNERTDGELLTAIINPSHKIAAGFPPELLTTGSRSRMGEYADVMTVRQLIDIVAFLHERYYVVQSEPPI
jgi:L-cysteine S-thiosulfotransferase